jgi:multiple RNA-binding domain-containing protein 1
MKEERLRQHFGQRGEVTDVKIMKTAYAISNCFCDFSAFIYLYIKSRSDGRSRLFGFIGFRTEKEAKAAMNFFNNTFIDTSKISVEMARPVRRYFFFLPFLLFSRRPPSRVGTCQVGDNALPRPWSKYSKGSSLHEQKGWSPSLSSATRAMANS